jgi:integrase
MAKRRGNGEGSIYQDRTGRWCALLTVGHNENGKRRRRYLYGATKAEVLEKLHATQADARTGLLVEPNRLTLGEFVRHWMKTSAEQRVRPTTLVTYRSLLDRNVVPYLSGTRLDKLQHVHLDAWHAQMERNGASMRTRRSAHVLLGTILRRAVKLGLIARNPLDRVDKPRVPEVEIQAFTPDQVRVLLDAARGHRLEALFVLAVTTGARQGELFGLEWRDVDLDAGMLTIQRTLLEAACKLSVGEPKTRKSRRSLNLPVQAVEALRTHRSRLPAVPHPTMRIFTDTEGRPLRKSNFIRRDWHPLLAKADLSYLKFHSLRHSHVTMLLAAGGNLKAVSERVGHSRTSMTSDVYAHAVQGMQQELADKLDQLIG